MVSGCLPATPVPAVTLKKLFRTMAPAGPGKVLKLWRKGKSWSAPRNMTLVTSHVVFPRLWVDSPCTMGFSPSIWFLSVECGPKKTSPASPSLYAL